MGEEELLLNVYKASIWGDGKQWCRLQNTECNVRELHS